MIESPGYTLSIYGISNRGFLPAETPLQCLQDPYFQPWEDILIDLPNIIRSGDLRMKVDYLPRFDTFRLNTEAEWRRAYVVFSFLTHAYIWGDQHPAERLPPQLSLPFSTIAEHFALPTTATYAGLNLWNWKPVTPDADITGPENLKVAQTFTGTSDEAWFYLISVSIEARGGNIIPTFLECFEAIRTENIAVIIQTLEKISDCLSELGCILDRMHERCDPTVFYHRIRPFLAGSKDMAPAGLPRGVFYDEGEGSGRWRQYSGGSNAQSSLIQLLDIALGIVHQATGDVSAATNDPSAKPKQSYISEMRNYMPGLHRHFLSHVSSIANIRQYVIRDGCDSAVRIAYGKAVERLTAFRGKHIRIVSRYIITPAQQLKLFKDRDSINIATTSLRNTKIGGSSVRLCGTGGTDLMPFLRQTRDETRNAASLS